MKLINSIWQYKSMLVMIIFITFIISLSSVNAFTPTPIYSSCYQETANVSHSSDGWCKSILNYSGKYFFSPNWVPDDNPKNTYDGDWNTYKEVPAGYNGTIIVNYSLPNQQISTAIWSIRMNTTLTPTINVSVNGTCFLTNPISLKVQINNSVGNVNTTFYCFNTTNWNKLLTRQLGGGNYKFYEEGIYLNITSLIENSQTYNQNVYETNTESFSLNVTYDTSYYSSISASLNYNGTSYSSTKTTSGSDAIFSRSIVIPQTNSKINNTVYWIIYATDNYGNITQYNSTFNNQTVNPAIIALCNGTYTVKALNFTMYNETSLTQINTTFKSTFFYNIGNQTSNKNVSFDLASNRTFVFCILPNATYNVYSSTLIQAAGFSDRTFSLIDSISNNSLTDKKLYLSDSVLDTNVILEFKNPSLTPLAGYYIETWRKYDSLGIDLPIHKDKTDSFGQIVENLIENTVKYKFKFYDSNGNLIKSTTEYVLVACKTSPCVITFINEKSTNIINYDNITNYDYSLTFNNATDSFIFSWNDNTGSTPFHRLLVERTSFGDRVIVCNTSSTALAGSLSCVVGSNYSSYTAQAFRYASPERRIGLLNYQVGDLTSNFGIEGVLWSFLLLMILVSVGSWNPPIGVVLYVVGFIALSVIGVLHAPPELIIAEIAIGVAFIWAWRG